MTVCLDCFWIFFLIRATTSFFSENVLHGLAAAGGGGGGATTVEVAAADDTNVSHCPLIPLSSNGSHTLFSSMVGINLISS